MYKFFLPALPALAALTLLGCDNQKLPTEPTISEMIENGTEKETFLCVKGGVSLKCEFLTKDSLTKDKWHRVTVDIPQNGNGLSLRVTGELFILDSQDGGFASGDQYGTFRFVGSNNSLAKIYLSTSNVNSYISVEVWSPDNERYINTSHNTPL